MREYAATWKIVIEFWLSSSSWGQPWKSCVWSAHTDTPFPKEKRETKSVCTYHTCTPLWGTCGSFRCTGRRKWPCRRSVGSGACRGTAASPSPWRSSSGRLQKTKGQINNAGIERDLVKWKFRGCAKVWRAAQNQRLPSQQTLWHRGEFKKAARGSTGKLSEDFLAPPRADDVYNSICGFWVLEKAKHWACRWCVWLEYKIQTDRGDIGTGQANLWFIEHTVAISTLENAAATQSDFWYRMNFTTKTSLPRIYIMVI